MVDAVPDRALAALLAPDADEPVSPPGDRAMSAPSMDERVQMFLHAMYGEDRDFTVEERAAVRDRILESMAASLAGDENGPDVFAGRRQAPGAAAVARLVASDRLGGALMRLSAAVREVLPFPLTGAGFTGGRRIALATALTLLIVGLGWSAAWWHAARTTETAIAGWMDSEAKSGRAYACGSRIVGGFPFRVDVSCIAPKAAIVAGRTTFLIEAKEVRTAVSVLRPGVLVTNIVGPVSIAEAGRPAAFHADWTAARTVVHAAANSVEQISLVLDAAQFRRVAEPGMAPLFTSDRLELDVRRDLAGAEPVFVITAHVDAGAIPTGGPIASQAFQGDAHAVLYGPEQAAKPISAWVRDWQAAGGHLEIRRARVEQGEAVGSAVGDVRLNAGGRLDGGVRIAAAGPYAQLAESFLQGGPGGAAERERIAQGLVAEGRLHSRALHAAPSANPPVAKSSPPAQGAARPAGSLDVPIRFVDGAVYAGDRLLAVIPPVF
jgi:hypothetical protein